MSARVGSKAYMESRGYSYGGRFSKNLHSAREMLQPPGRFCMVGAIYVRWEFENRRARGIPYAGDADAAAMHVRFG